MRHPIRAVLLAASVVVLSVDLAHAAASEADRTFIDQAASAGHAEIAAGESAATSANPAIADFGRQMVREHGQMNQELTALATKMGVQPPDSASLAGQAEDAMLSVLPGATFDRTCVSQQLTKHKEALSLLESEASSGDAVPLREFSEKYVPVVEQHIAELETLQKLPELQ